MTVAALETSAHASDRTFLRRFDPVLALILLGLSVGVLLVHDIEYMLSHPFWTDEAWVAVFTNFPFREWVGRSSSTPLGWIFLLDLAPSGHLRLVPLAFSVGVVTVAAVLAYQMEWSSRWKAWVAALFVGGAAGLSPASLIRNDLKHYTADACLSLVVLVFAGLLDRRWTTRRLAIFVVVAVASASVSYVSMFVSGAVFLVLLATALLRRHDRIVPVIVAGAGTGTVFVLIGMLVVLPSLDRALFDYWEQSYLEVDDGVGTLANIVWERMGQVVGLLGLSTFAVVALTGLGLKAMRILARPLIGGSVVVLFLMMFALGMLGLYPFLDVRTSHFLLVMLTVIVSIAIVYGLLGERRQTVGSFVTLVAVAVAVVATGWPHVRAESIPNEDVRSQVRYVEEAMRPGDVVLVNMPGSNGVTYYWSQDAPLAFVDNDALATGWMTIINRDDMVFATGRDYPAVREALDQARDLAVETGGQMWIIRTHVNGPEDEAWMRALSDLELEPVSIPVGSEDLLLLGSH